MVLKAYALESRLPYSIDNKNYDILDEKLYLTDEGIEWLYSIFRKHSFGYLRRVFQFVFSKATPASLKQLETYEGLNNFRGTTGERPKAGSKQKAILIRRHGRVEQVFNFDTIHEARQEVLMLTRFYSPDELTLYRVRTQNKKGREYQFKEKIPLLLGESKRGLAINLPHLKE